MRESDLPQIIDLVRQGKSIRLKVVIFSLFENLVTVDLNVNNTILALVKVYPFFPPHKCAIP